MAICIHKKQTGQHSAIKQTTLWPMALTHEGLEVMPWKLKPGMNSDSLAGNREGTSDVLKAG